MLGEIASYFLILLVFKPPNSAVYGTCMSGGGAWFTRYLRSRGLCVCVYVGGWVRTSGAWLWQNTHHLAC